MSRCSAAAARVLVKNFEAFATSRNLETTVSDADTTCTSVVGVRDDLGFIRGKLESSLLEAAIYHPDASG